MIEPDFAHLVLKYDDTTSLTFPAGGRFIRKLPDDRSLGYLHKLFPPVNNFQLEELEAALGRQLPKAYQEFLLWSDGACFFDNSIYLFGFSENLSRSLEPEHQSAISIRMENRLFSATDSDYWAEGWTKIGSVVGGKSNFDLLLHGDGSCAISDGASSYIAESFDDCLNLILGRVEIFFSRDGLINRDYVGLEASLASLVHAKN